MQAHLVRRGPVGGDVVVTYLQRVWSVSLAAGLAACGWIVVLVQVALPRVVHAGTMDDAVGWLLLWAVATIAVGGVVGVVLEVGYSWAEDGD